jgi:hypothetical protein
VADFVKDDIHLFAAKKRIAGLQLTDTDMDWSHGHGPEVTGPAEALVVMMMAGRLVAFDDLSGGGTADLASRLSLLRNAPLPGVRGQRAREKASFMTTAIRPAFDDGHGVARQYLDPSGRLH